MLPHRERSGEEVALAPWLAALQLSKPAAVRGEGALSSPALQSSW